ncbi:TetR/AcrR family transcriptional regulator [Roseibacterium sp. SDUM158017]|uniref:TetR/AcrR family transcriptional regulator n=1 Tax=Roseicyclus salinarum TaxID=3036773 RepID=UPI00241595FA|nr:TetR/AcrR family transcriptional regulator [Roseibacterium sp. SDUM158017]MDG4647023.1 TetR/AcrR family transcriptional regulator [Roseibacterium sp. SDUM158017]
MPRGLARDHAAKRDAIRHGAAAHFAALGYDRASMASVATACGVSKALIYHYYDSKEALLVDILQDHLSRLLDAILEAGQDGTAKERLRDTIRAILLQYEDADDAHMVQLDALDTLPEAMRQPLVAMMREMVSQLGERLDAASPEGLGDRRRAITMSVFGMLNWFYTWHRPGRWPGREDYADLVTDLVAGGLGGL